MKKFMGVFIGIVAVFFFLVASFEHHVFGAVSADDHARNVMSQKSDGGNELTSSGMKTLNTATPTATATPGASYFSVEVEVVPESTEAGVGESFNVTVNIINNSVGCIFPVYDLTLDQDGEDAPVFYPPSSVVGPPVGETTVFTLTADSPGTVTFYATAHGERYCNDYWQWMDIIGESEPVTVTEPSPTPWPEPTYTPTPTATPTAVYTYFSVDVQVIPESDVVAAGEEFEVTVNIINNSVGCIFPVYELTLTQEGEDAPVFSPETVVEGPPVSETTVFTLTADSPGTVTFKASAYGERYCNDFWQWMYINGQSDPVTVIQVSPTPTQGSAQVPAQSKPALILLIGIASVMLLLRHKNGTA